MSEREWWFEIRESLFKKGFKQEGPNLFCYDGKSAIIYTLKNHLDIQTVLELISKHKTNDKFTLPLWIITNPDVEIDEKCEFYMRIMKKELKICSINDFNI